jgi:hypothetical protein
VLYPKPERLEEFLGILGALQRGFTPDIAAGVENIHTCLNRDGQFPAPPFISYSVLAINMAYED